MSKSRFLTIGWRIECPGSIPRGELLELLPRADGLLLLSASNAAIPSKLFEYVPSGRPIFVVTEKDSITWRICNALSQACVVEVNLPSKHYCDVLDKPFYFASEIDVPYIYSEEYLSPCFRSTLKLNDFD